MMLDKYEYEEIKKLEEKKPNLDLSKYEIREKSKEDKNDD